MKMRLGALCLVIFGELVKCVIFNLCCW